MQGDFPLEAMQEVGSIKAKARDWVMEVVAPRDEEFKRSKWGD